MKSLARTRTCMGVDGRNDRTCAEQYPRNRVMGRGWRSGARGVNVVLVEESSGAVIGVNKGGMLTALVQGAVWYTREGSRASATP